MNLKDVLIVVTGDHSTCSLKKSHCNLPNPILIFGAKKDGCKKFSGRECKKRKTKNFKTNRPNEKDFHIDKGFSKNKIE